MTLLDLASHAIDNLRRSRLRSILTVIGIVISVGFLITMVSLGTGLEEWANEDFVGQDLFATLQVLPKMTETEDERGRLTRSVKHLTEEAYEEIGALPGIDMVFPELRFPVRVRLGSSETAVNLVAIPLQVAQQPPFDKVAFGTFLTGGDLPGIVVSQQLLRNLNVRVVDDVSISDPAAHNGDDDLLPVAVTELLGHELEIISTSFDRRAMLRSFATPSDNIRPEFQNTTVRIPIVGIREGFSMVDIVRGQAIISLELARQLPSMGFDNVRELSRRGEAERGYSSVFVRASSPDDAEQLRHTIEGMGYEVFSYAENFKEIQTFLWIFDSIMALLGGVGVLVATLSIANTMLTSVLERTREIGILVAIGADERDVRRIYYVEAATIGLIGGVVGVGCAWVATHLGNYILYEFMVPAGVERIAVLRMPPWLAGAGVSFAVIVSWLGGAYPAYRAARIDPVKALRHD